MHKDRQKDTVIYHALHRDVNASEMIWDSNLFKADLFSVFFEGVGCGGVYFTLGHTEHVLLLAYSDKLKIINL